MSDPDRRPLTLARDGRGRLEVASTHARVDEEQASRVAPPPLLRFAQSGAARRHAALAAADGKIVIERRHSYGAVSQEEFVSYRDGAVEAVRYGHWLVGDPAVRRFVVVTTSLWQLTYEHGRPARYEFSDRDGDTRSRNTVTTSVDV